jgi:hypothetical protein
MCMSHFSLSKVASLQSQTQLKARLRITSVICLQHLVSHHIFMSHHCNGVSVFQIIDKEQVAHSTSPPTLQMSLVPVTATAITTVTVVITATASLLGQPTTVTTNIFTTVIGLPGQTVTILPPPVTVGDPQSTFVQGSTLPPLYTVTVTEVDAFVQAPGGSIWTRVIYDETGNAAAPTPVSWNEPYLPGEKVLVLPDLNIGWSSWSTGQKAGLCAGVVLIILALLLLWWCCLDRRQEWVVQPRGTYWNGGYWGAGLRGGGGRWNIRKIAIKWKTADTTRQDNLGEEEGGEEERGSRRAWQTNVQQRSARALDQSRQGFLDGNRNNGGPGKVRKQTSLTRYRENASNGESEVHTERSDRPTDNRPPFYQPPRHE